MHTSIKLILLFFISLSSFVATAATTADSDVTKIVVQLTRSSENFGHRKTFFQIDKVLSEIGENKLKIIVVAYEDGIHALTQDSRSAQMLTKLSNKGVIFKACKISMNAWELTEDDFPLEVEFVPAGAPEMIRRQIAGYKYWKP
jgi:uncharacterized protein